MKDNEFDYMHKKIKLMQSMVDALWTIVVVNVAVASLILFKLYAKISLIN